MTTALSPSSTMNLLLNILNTWLIYLILFYLELIFIKALMLLSRDFLQPPLYNNTIPLFHNLTCQFLIYNLAYSYIFIDI